MDEEKVKAEQEQLEKDVKAFNAELIPLLGKYNLGLGGQAFLTPDGRTAARPMIFRPQPTPTEEATPAAPAPEVIKEA